MVSYRVSEPLGGGQRNVGQETVEARMLHNKQVAAIETLVLLMSVVGVGVGVEQGWWLT
jgi:hypothetical protein